jgi:hypothetical protein
MRLTPLLHIEDILLRRLMAPGSGEARLLDAAVAAPDPRSGGSSSRPGSSSRRRPGTGSSARSSARLAPLNTNLPPVDPKLKAREAAVNSTAGWKDAFARILPIDPGASMDELPPGLDTGGEDPGRVLAACCADVQALWADPVIQQLMLDRKVRLEDMSGLSVAGARAGGRVLMRFGPASSTRSTASVRRDICRQMVGAP